MIEIQITCLAARPITITDLNLVMNKGDVVYISVEAAAKSAELKILWKARGVIVRRVQRSRERRPVAPIQKPPKKSKGLAPRVLARPRPKNRGSARKTAPPTQTPPTQPFDAKALAELRRGLRSDLTKLTNDAVDRLLPAIKAIPGQVGQPGPAISSVAAPAVDDSMPIFIPEGIVGDAKADISVESGESNTSSVDAASEALKKAKKKRRKKSKKKE